MAPWLLRLAGLVAFPILALVGIDFSEAGDTLRETRIGLAIAALALLEAGVLLRAWRWRLIAEALGVRYGSFRDYASLFHVGLFAGVALPQTAASFTPALFMAEDGHPWQRSVGSIIADRALEALMALLFAVAASIYLFPILPRLSLSVILAGAVILAGLAALYVYRRQVAGWLGALGKRYPAVTAWPARLEAPALAGALCEGRQRVARAAALAAAIALLDAVFAVVAAAALDIDASWVFIAMAWNVVALVIMLPISIGGLGPREGMFVLLFAAAGKPEEAALSLGLLMFTLGLLVRAPGIVAWAGRRPRTASSPRPPPLKE